MSMRKAPDSRLKTQREINTYSIRDIRHHAIACKEFRLDTQCLVTEQGLTDIHHTPAREGGIFDLLLNDGIS
jgi:hypothetical protein